MKTPIQHANTQLSQETFNEFNKRNSTVLCGRGVLVPPRQLIASSTVTLPSGSVTTEGATGPVVTAPISIASIQCEEIIAVVKTPAAIKAKKNGRPLKLDKSSMDLEQLKKLLASGQKRVEVAKTLSVSARTLRRHIRKLKNLGLLNE
jgi:hypothetical protein